jgi:vitamin B12 transporter
VEVFAEVKLDSGFRFEGSYTYIDATENGVEEVLRAPHIASAALSWRSMDDVFGGFVNLRYNGRQKDNNFTFSGTNPAVLRSFTLVDAGGDWKFNEHLQIFGRIENLFDENYEEVYTFRTAGRAFYVGVRGNI